MSPKDEDELTTGHLPPNTPQAIGSTLRGITTVVMRELGKDNPTSYILFSNVPPNIIRPSDDTHIPGLSSTRITYNSHTKTLVVKLQSPSHQGAELYLTREIILVTNTVDHSLKRELKLLGAATVTHQGISTQPDASFQTLNLPPGREMKWPSVVVKSGGGRECLDRLHADARFWISRSCGQVKAVVVISAERDREEILFEEFVPDDNLSPPPPPLRAICQQRVVVTRDQGQTVVTGCPLVIAFDEMFLRAAANGVNEHDYVFGQQVLVEIAEDTWHN